MFYSREVGRFFHFLIFHWLECTEKIEGKETFSNIMKKKFQSGLFSPLGRWTRNNFLFKGGLSEHLTDYANGTIHSPYSPDQHNNGQIFSVGLGKCLSIKKNSILCFTSYFDHVQHSCSSTQFWYYHLLLRQDTRIPGVVPSLFE